MTDRCGYYNTTHAKIGRKGVTSDVYDSDVYISCENVLL